MKIKTEYVYPPIPGRQFDWSAIDDDTYDGAGSPIGWGRTEREAILDLMGAVRMNTSDLLLAIKSKAEWLQQDARTLADFIGMLAIRRDFPTLAEKAMDEAESELIEALKSVRNSRTAYLNKPKERTNENLSGISV